MKSTGAAPPMPSARTFGKGGVFAAAGAGAIVLGAGLAYANSLAGPFIFDDREAILKNTSIRHLFLALSPPHDGTTVTGRPFLNLSFALNYALGGISVAGFHVLNLAIHALAGLALFAILRRIFAAVALEGNPVRSELLALGSALLWTLHPLQTESVTYVVQRAESLMGLFYLATVYGFVRYAEASDPVVCRGFSAAGGIRGAGLAARGRAWAAFSVVSCFCGMATKEVMVSAPVIVVLWDSIFFAGNLRDALRRRWRMHALLASSWVLLAGLVISAKGRGGTAGFGVGVSWGQYLVTQFPALCRYLELSFWPLTLVLDYGVQWVESPGTVVPQAAAVMLLAGGALAALFSRTIQIRAVGFAGAVFFAILAPTSLVPGARQTMAEHRMYLALAPVVALGVAGVEALLLGALARNGRNTNEVARTVTPMDSFKVGGPTLFIGLVLAAAAAVLGTLTALRNRDYATEIKIWQDVVAKVPGNSFAHNGLGVALYEHGQTEEAMAEYAKALTLNPGFADARSNQGSVLMEQGHVQDAKALFERALQLRPADPQARSNLGSALAKMGRSEEALVQFEAALSQVPDDSKVLGNYAKALLQVGRLAESLAAYQKAIYCDPDDAEAHFGYGIALSRKGDRRGSEEQFAEAVRCRPDYAEAQNNLGMALAQSGKTDEALPRFREAVRLAPDNAGFRFNLGNVLAQSGRGAEAIVEYERALRMDPSMNRAREMIARLKLGTP